MPKVYNKHHGDFPSSAVYIGRPSKWGNPFEIGKDGDRDTVVHKHWLYVHSNPELIRSIRRDLSGKDLLCFCTPKPCHGDTLLRIANAPDTVNAFRGEFYFLSNFFPARIRAKSGIVYPTAEHAYQAFKTRDWEVKRHIAGLLFPEEAKKFARRLNVRSDWDAVRNTVMLRVLRAKFFQNPHLARMLIDTLGATLIEGNYWNDTYWGVCNGVGENVLGALLMQVREELTVKTFGRPLYEVSTG